MTTTKTPTLSLALLVACIYLPGGLAAQESSLAATASKAKEAFGSGKTVETLKSIRLLKEAGLSYQENLLAPLDGALDCKDPGSQLAVLSGIYWVDATYVIAFGKRERWAATHRYVLSEVNERSTMKEKVKLGTIMRSEIWKKVVEDPTNEANIDALFKTVQARMDERFEQAKNDPEVMAFLVDRYYGMLLEFGYLGCKLALAAPGGEKLIPVYSSIAEQVEGLLPVLDSIQDPGLQADVNRKERMELLGALKDTIRSKAGKLTSDDLQAMLKLVEPARSSYVARCK